MKRWFANVSLTLFGILVCVLIFESGLRIGGVSYPSFYTWDEYRGAALRPGAAGWSHGDRKVWIRINSAGFRDREHVKTKPTNTLRIAVLGDSYVEAKQVHMEDAFWMVLEHELAKCQFTGDRSVEVLSFGVSGYGTTQEIMTLRHRVWDYSPNIVILAFLTGNDVRNNSRALQNDPMRPYFIYKDGGLVFDASFRDLAAFRARQTIFAKFVYWALNYSRVLQVINKVKNNLRRASRIQVRQKRNGSQNIIGQELGLDDNVYLEPIDHAWKESWEVTEGLIVLMRDEVEEKGRDFLVVTLSNGIQVHPDPSIRQAFMEDLGSGDLFYPDSRIKALGDREGFMVLNLGQDFQAYAEQHKVFLHGSGTNLGNGHWNLEGHRLAGEIIARKLCKEVISKQNGSVLN